eukprot:gene9292-9457_t
MLEETEEEQQFPSVRPLMQRRLLLLAARIIDGYALTQARLRQEEEDHLLALRLAEAYATEGGDEPDFAGSDSDPDWQRVPRPATTPPTSDNTTSAEHGAAAHAGNGGSSGAEPLHPLDPLAQLLLAGARSAAANRQAGSSGLEQQAAGFTHYNPASGAAHFEPAATWGPFGGPMASADLDGLIGALMGGGMFPGLGSDGEGAGRFRYEDLVGLDPVHVTTPPDVLQGLPTSTFVEGRKPGDR